MTPSPLVALARRVAALRPATREFNPGIGPGMLNSLIEEAKLALCSIEKPTHAPPYPPRHLVRISAHRPAR